jgi:hypothetical protein
MTSNKVISTMFDIESSIHMDRIVFFWDQDEDPGLSTHCIPYFSQVVMEIIWLICILLHRSTLNWFVDMFLSYRISTVYSFVVVMRSFHGGMDPHCIFGGHLHSWYHYGSIMYWLAAMLWVIYILSIGMPTSEMQCILILFDDCLQLLLGSPTPPPLH